MLIPNLKEIMEEFAETTKETTLDPVTTVKEEESQEKIAEAKTKVEEGRKRKRKEEEDKEQSSGEEIEDFLYDKVYEIMEKKILKKEFIGERGFKELISPFKEIIKKKGWNIICKHMPPRRAALVRESMLTW